MKSYIFSNYKGGKTLYPKDSWNVEEYLAEHESRFMTEYDVKDEHGKTYKRYRFRTCDPAKFVDTLEYDIECPHCHDKLRLCGLPLDSLNHGLYKCRRCDEKAERR